MSHESADRGAHRCRAHRIESDPARAATLRGHGRTVEEFDMHHRNAWPERFWSKVEKTDTCWLWRAHITRDGYGTIQMQNQSKLAHRVSYDLNVGPIPDGLTLDHLCRVRSCVNPAHLEPVTNAVNVARGIGPSALHARQTHCKRGHEFNETNTKWITKDGRKARRCLTCVREVYEPKRRPKVEPRFTDDQVRTIYALAWSGVPHADIAARFGLKRSAISNIKQGRSYAHITGHRRAA